LDDLEKKLRPLGERELKVLKELKAKDRAARGLEPEDEFFVWDYRFYDRLYVEESLSLDENAVKEYFPVSKVVPTILQIYQDLLGVRFEQANAEQAGTWHEEVQAYAVWEKDAKDGEGFIGWCYLDLFPRRKCFYPTHMTDRSNRLFQLRSTAMQPCSRSVWVTQRVRMVANIP
jgi:Zn-dependent oligopeptidase